MNLLYAVIGYCVGVVTCYFAFMVGRNTGYQDKNIPPPPSPAPKLEVPSLNKILSSKPLPQHDPKIVGDLDEVDFAAMEEFKRRMQGAD